jgi:hypothetical protein
MNSPLYEFIEYGGNKMRNLIAVVSFAVAAIGGLAVMFIRNRDKQTMSSIVAGAFLISFFINVSRDAKLVLQVACMVAFGIAVLGAFVTIFSNDENTRTAAIVTGLVSLGASIFMLLTYLEFNPF